jgi:REP-associated tyrosine transposase
MALGELVSVVRGSAEDQRLLAPWPLPRQANWVQHVSQPLTDAELTALQRSVQRGSPFGSPQWCERTIQRLGLETTIRPRGRPKQAQNGS